MFSLKMEDIVTPENLKNNSKIFFDFKKVSDELITGKYIPKYQKKSRNADNDRNFSFLNFIIWLKVSLKYRFLGHFAKCKMRIMIKKKIKKLRLSKFKQTLSFRMPENRHF